MTVHITIKKQPSGIACNPSHNTQAEISELLKQISDIVLEVASIEVEHPELASIKYDANTEELTLDYFKLL